MATNIGTNEKLAKPSTLLDSKFPVFLPYFPDLFVSDSEFKSRLQSVNTSSKPLSKKSDVQDLSKNAVKVASPFIQGLEKSAFMVHDAKTLALQNKTFT